METTKSYRVDQTIHGSMPLPCSEGKTVTRNWECNKMHFNIQCPVTTVTATYNGYEVFVPFSYQLITKEKQIIWEGKKTSLILSLLTYL